MKIQGKVWGSTSPVFNKNNVEIHFCAIKVGGYCSKHFHRTKYNRFVVLEGKLKVTIWKEYSGGNLEDVTYLTAGDECTVNPGDYHKFEAILPTTLLEIYWVELDKNDIIRFDQGGIINAP